MLVRVQLFASFRQAVGSPSLELDLTAEPSVGELLARLRVDVPELGPAVDRAMVAVNLEYVGPEHRLAAGDEVAIIPPVSGG